jgi:hypothetical protein
MSSRISSLIGGRPGFSTLLRRAQWSQKRLRCHAITVAGWTKTRTSRHAAQWRDSQDQKMRSSGRMGGRLTVR